MKNSETKANLTPCYTPVNRQEAPYPSELSALIAETEYKSWRLDLVDGLVRDQPNIHGEGGSVGLTLIILITEPDSYHKEQLVRVNHYFPVPPATYDRRSWQRWLFERILEVERHEAMENFIVAGTHPYAPSHGPGNDPYLVREVGTVEDQRTSFRGDLKEEKK